MTTQFADRLADYGQRWGEGAARCFSIDCDFLDDAQGLRLMPVPDSFFCPISAAIMNDPVATVDGCSYEREYIERWFRERRQFRQPITSPTTGLQLQSTTLMPLMALQRAIEAYLLHRPELKRDHLAGRSFEEAAQVLQIDLLEKQASNATVHEELVRLREANRALKRALRETEAVCKKVQHDLERARLRVRELEEGRTAAMIDSVCGISAESSSAPSDSPKSGRCCDKPPAPAPALVHEKQQQPLKPAATAWVPRTSPRAKMQTRGLPPKVQVEGRRPARSESATPKGSWSADGNVKQLLQGALLAALIALCFYLHFRSPPAIKAHRVDGGSLPWEHTHADLSISRQIEHLQYGTADERRFAALALQKFATESEESMTAVVEAGAPQLLVRLLEDDDFLWVQEASAATLATLASSSVKSQAAVARAGAISPLVQILKSGDVDILPKAAASALRHLAAGNEKNQVAIVRAGAIAPLVEIMRSDAPNARLEAALALREIAGEGLEENRYSKQVAITQAGAILPLVRLIRDEAPGARQAAAGTLRMLATNNADNQVAIAQAGAIGPLVELLRDAGSPGARREAAVALNHLAVFDVEPNFGNQVAIGQAGAIEELSKLLQDAVPDVAFAAAAALRSLSVGNADNLHRVVQALREAPQIQGEAAGPALASLAQGNADIQAAILQWGVSSDLLKGGQL